MATKKSNNAKKEDNSGVFRIVGNLARGTDPKLRRGSIINSAKGNIFEFPAFISSSVDVDYATATTSLLEQVYASYLQMAISANPVIDAKTAKEGQQFSDYKTDTNKYLEYTDTMYQHDACHAVYHNPDCILEFNMLSIDDTTAQYINEYCNHEPLSEFDHFFQEAQKNDDYYKSTTNTNSLDKDGNPVYPSSGTTKIPSDAEKDILDKQLQKLQKEIDRLTNEANSITDEQRQQKVTDELRKLAAEAGKAENEKQLSEKKLNDYNKTIQKLDAEIEKLSNEGKLAKKRYEDYDDDRRMAREKHAFDTKAHGPQMLDETKIQKLNTMKPLMMSVNMKLTNAKGEITGVTEYVAGVKVHARLIDAEILPEVAEFPLKEMNKLTRKAKWRAGELKFFRDIVFRIKQKKQTAIDSRDPKRKWYRRLYELAHMKGDSPTTSMSEGNSIPRTMINQFLGKGNPNGVLPNASIIVSKEDVDNVKSQTGIDLLNGKTAANFCNELFLISFIVIDTDAQSVKLMLPDLHNDFEIHSMASVNKQLATLDTSGDKTREMLKALGR